MTLKAKDWLTVEADRNRANADLFTAIMRKAYGQNESILIGHHLCFQCGNDIATENEIPAADSLIFDIEIMRAVFGDDADWLLPELSLAPANVRDEMLQIVYEQRYGKL